MPEVDFLMTYPCYFLLTEKENPESVVIDGERCICLFTDIHLVEPFYKDKHGDNFATRQIQTWTMTERIGLLKTLKDWQPELAPQNVTHVAIDATPGKQTSYVTIAELIEDLENRTD